MILTEELRRAYEATDQILSNRPDDEFVIICAIGDERRFYVSQTEYPDGDVDVCLTPALLNALRLRFTEALDVKEKLDAFYDDVVVQLARDAPESLERKVDV